MSRRLDLGDLHVGPYCGARVWRPRDWRAYGLFRRIENGFSIGPLLFWREHILSGPPEWDELGTGYTNLDRAEELVADIERVRAIQRELKAAFARDELDGGPKAALTHPLYLQAQARLAELHDELKLLI